MVVFTIAILALLCLLHEYLLLNGAASVTLHSVSSPSQSIGSDGPSVRSMFSPEKLSVEGEHDGRSGVSVSEVHTWIGRRLM
jgi:hypothetical protein